jgi:lysylphosphatidylglycerol synthetase-like protein (DUF2156 family)
MLEFLKPIVYGACVLFAAWFVVHKLEFSPTSLISLIAKEMKLLTTQGNWTRGSVNGLAVIVVGLILLLYFFFDRAKQLIEFTHKIGAPASHSSASYEIVICLFLFVVLALLSARSLPGDS